ncbi:MAG: sugar kinase [Spirochaetales bacterium]|nr:sugar kinase [Spirochaetales bacterium]
MSIICFGEIMARIAPPHHHKILQGFPGPAEITFGGSEANVCASLAMMGQSTRFVSALPSHALAEACLNQLRGFGVDVSHTQRDDGRLGLYFVEKGANQRPSTVIYDRENSSINHFDLNQVNWNDVFDGAQWFHCSGITPALSRSCYETVLFLVKEAAQRNIPVSCDLNFRNKLWRWDDSCAPKELARQCMGKILHHVDVVIGNEEDASDVLDIYPQGTDVEQGQLSAEAYISVAQQIGMRFPKLRQVAITLRESLSATQNNWGAMLYSCATQQTDFAPLKNGDYSPYPITNIVDRVGGGDSFAAGLIFALLSKEYGDCASAISFAVAASCLCHSISGDYNYSSREEVEALMKGRASGRVQR